MKPKPSVDRASTTLPSRYLIASAADTLASCIVSDFHDLLTEVALSIAIGAQRDKPGVPPTITTQDMADAAKLVAKLISPAEPYPLDAAFTEPVVAQFLTFHSDLMKYQNWPRLE